MRDIKCHGGVLEDAVAFRMVDRVATASLCKLHRRHSLLKNPQNDRVKPSKSTAVILGFYSTRSAYPSYDAEGIHPEVYESLQGSSFTSIYRLKNSFL